MWDKYCMWSITDQENGPVFILSQAPTIEQRSMRSLPKKPFLPYFVLSTGEASYRYHNW